jgi:CDP-diacylglycerol--glycerol-3-phosphate 3-phosphatidyltransferase
VLGREMFVTSLRSFLESEGRDFSATASGKIKMVLQCVAVSAATFSLDPWIMASPGATFVFVVREASVWLAGAATIWSGWEYTVRAIRILRG